jgi:amylosucrase
VGSELSARVAKVFDRIRSDIVERADDRLDEDGASLLLTRVDYSLLDVVDALEAVYGRSGDIDPIVDEAMVLVVAAATARSPRLRLLDHQREIDPTWFLRARQVGYACYVDRLAGTLAGVAEHLDHLTDLGVTYLHLMPLLRSRVGENDGGYAVEDYESVDPALGTMSDLEHLADALHSRQISLCIDVVLNHTAREHEWARRAIAGDAEYGAYYHVFPDRELPDQYERSLVEVFPDFAPGSFTEVAGLGWVWTTFHEFQWDLNYANPTVFLAMLRTMLSLANRGIDVLRLDAVPFMWKRMGTDCRDQPEAHRLVQAFRALVRMAAPGVIFKAEAIVPPDQLVQYLGAHERFRPECDLAYNNQLMVMLWSSVATRDARLITTSLASLRPLPPATTWVNYVRCHDDIGWAVDDGAAAAVGWTGPSHRSFLNAFYSGSHPGSFARGALFQENPATGDARISGTAASLCGIEQALELGDAHLLEQAVRRLVLLYSVVFSYGGIPLIYMGDELALRNDPRYLDSRATADDNRWMHRPVMDWDAAARRGDPATLEGRVWAEFVRLAGARRSTLALRGGSETTPLWTDNVHVFAYRRRHARSGAFLALVNFDDHEQTCSTSVMHQAGLVDPVVVLGSEPGDRGDGLPSRHGRLFLPGLGFLWLVDR